MGQFLVYERVLLIIDERYLGIDISYDIFRSVQ